ncbi:hypothetical protein, unlikely [Trypanosoma brucei gambiense DAL972]|uniref:Uncharacterized protein n=1 Tax=Trypanosoma brucei gambiense (strain MHOM/CI/86/DAL972) TaxID=679716 RepID=D0A7Z3_TRYB9|nr:hypothetical protein, unlikely [Trypanosoma brucei gambiense DAL972]CBH17794.1 hypothetical protein, unlikely [Trypanosoma brucei gambiense DAL972]|eukprot:XP_011780058.1 hypothetical protein, unlikely [Trypanosoma brucei gambiense DAL972]
MGSSTEHGVKAERGTDTAHTRQSTEERQKPYRRNSLPPQPHPRTCLTTRLGEPYDKPTVTSPTPRACRFTQKAAQLQEWPATAKCQRSRHRRPPPWCLSGIMQLGESSGTHSPAEDIQAMLTAGRHRYKRSQTQRTFGKRRGRTAFGSGANLRKSIKQLGHIASTSVAPNGGSCFAFLMERERPFFFLSLP